MQPRSGTWGHWSLLALVLCAAFFALHQSGLFDRLERMSYDARLAWLRDRTPLPDEVAVILIDDASLQAMEGLAGRWPWPRSIYAELLEFFSLAPPQALVFDILFSERTGGGGLGAPLNEDDRALTEATAAAPFVIHAARLLHEPGHENDRHATPLPPRVRERFDPAQRYGGTADGYYRAVELPSNDRHYLPFPELLQASPMLGIVDVQPDPDGVYRRLRLLHRYQDTLLPALGLAPWLERQRPPWIAVEAHRLRLGEVEIPLDEQGHYLINFYPRIPAYSFSGIMASLAKIRRGELEDLPVSPFEFEGKIVFLGASAAGLEDLKNTPLDARLPGVHLHAAVTANLLQRDFLHPYPTWSGLLLGLALIPLLVSAMALSAPAWLRLALPLIAGSGYLLSNLALFHAHTVLPLIPPLIAVILAAVGAYAQLMLTEGREKARIKRMMSQYLSPAVLETVVARHNELARAEVGSREELTILFSDIRGFTSLSEKLPPERVVELLNHYFSAMTETIFRHRGTIDKFIGDAIMAFWGAPLPAQDHADQAVLTALEMHQALEKVNAWLQQRRLPAIAIGVGIHSGEVILGNIGSEHKLDYTVIGDNVNLASRIEGLTKHYATPVLISEASHKALQRPIPCRVVDLVRVKGKRRPIRIYQPLGHPDQLQSRQLERLQRLAHDWEAVMESYLARQWELTRNLLARLPDEPLKTLYLQRVNDFLRHEPAPEWDGVYTLHSK